MEAANATRIVNRVSALSIAMNLTLTVFKLLAGILGHSSAMVSDAIHSASDVFGTVIALIGVREGERADDQDHQYGHERLECIAAILLAVILFATGCGIGLSALKSMLLLSSAPIQIPTVLPLTAALVSIAVKEGLYWVTRIAAKKINSSALIAEAWHHRSDALSSVGSFVGIFGARMGLPILDPIASLVICLLILKVAVGIFRSTVGELTDRACDQSVSSAMETVILDQPGVLGVDLLKTRAFARKIYVDVEISADGDQTLESAHRIAEAVHHAIESGFPDVKHCMVHVNPFQNQIQ